jgi:hypothetical protein
MKKCTPSLAIKEIQIKTTWRFYLTLLKELSSKAQTTTNVGKNVGKKEPSYTAGRNVNKNSQFGKQYGGSSKN